MINERAFIIEKGEIVASDGTALRGYECRRYWGSILLESPEMVFGILKTLSLLDPIMVTFDEYNDGHNVEIEFYLSSDGVNNFMRLDKYPCSIKLNTNYYNQLKNLFEIEYKGNGELEK